MRLQKNKNYFETRGKSGKSMAVWENNRKFANGNQRLGIMVETNDRILPVGIQSFEKIRKGGYLYVDKTDIIWQLANRGKKYNYLSRPRRFGKSVLVDTLEAYFMGKKELFEGLKIMQMETEWVKRPVIRLDMSQAGAEPESIRSYLDYTFQEYESLYEIEVSNNSSLATRLSEIVRIAYEQTGQQVVILIDEYDSPLQHSWKTPLYEKCTAIYRDVFVILKSMDKYENFIFITGCTKFSQFSLTSVIIALKQYRLYHSNDTASLAWLQASLFTWLAIPV